MNNTIHLNIYTKEDWDRLKEMDLTKLGCQRLEVEHNTDWVLLRLIREYAARHGLKKEILYNTENIILVEGSESTDYMDSSFYFKGKQHK